ncbi:MAG: nucleoside hydrolase [Planctomycetaceae bacterium]|nr:nucleoside hydrolase [Planctomycetaceae bacterium]
MSKKLIIDTDSGIGDTLAVLVAMVDPTIDVLGLTATGGTVSGVQATRNLQFITGLADPLRHPRIGQSEIEEAPGEHVPPGAPAHSLLNGRFGLGDADPRVPDLHNRRESAKLIVDIVREHPQEVRILSLGPLTNIAMAFEFDPELPMILGGLTCLGGAIHCPGDVTAVAEFNMWADPLAARSVLNSPAGKVMVPLDVSLQPMLTFEDIDRISGLIPSTAIGEFVTALMHYSLRATRQHMPQEGLALSAVTALAVAVRAERFSFETASVDVETAGNLTTGMTVVDGRRTRTSQNMIDVVTQVDEQAVVDYFCRSIRRVSM